MSRFHLMSVANLQNYLRERGVTFSGSRKKDLVRLCINAEELNIEIDPDGLSENSASIITTKLTTDDGFVLPSPQHLAGTANMSGLPELSIFDIYNYLLSYEEFTHASLREYHKLEGYCMFKNGYVKQLEKVSFDINGYVGIKAEVKPRTNDNDPVTKKSCYSCWIILRKTSDACIHSAFCTCKGGIDGCCRHVVATLFEVNNYQNDFMKVSCTSQPCSWIRRPCQADHLGKAIPVAQLDTSVLQEECSSTPRPLYSPVPPEKEKPNTEVFLEQLKKLCPTACGLRSRYVYNKDIADKPPQLSVCTPIEKIKQFNSDHVCIEDSCKCVNIFLYYHLCYNDVECKEIEQSTRGQSLNKNWHDMRKGLLTASRFHQICNSRNLLNTATALLQNSSLNEDHLPAQILFGRRYEAKARNLFIKGHKFKHRQLKLHVPGLVCREDMPFLACSPDGIVDCATCGRFLIEVKCLFKYKCFHPKNALKLSNICTTDDQGNLSLKRSNKYFDQIQGQMAITGVHRCILVCYTHKGLATVEVPYDDEFWKSSFDKLSRFYKEVYFPMVRSL